MSAKLGIKAHQYLWFIFYFFLNCFWLSAPLIENVRAPLWLICFDPSHERLHSCSSSSAESENEWIHSRQLYPSLLLCRSIFQLQLCFVVSLSLSVFASSAAFFAIKARRNQSVTVSSETGKESKSVWKRCSQDDDKRDSDASAVWQPCCRKHFARIGPVAEVNQPKWSQRVTKHSTGVVWFHSAQTAEWFVLWPFCLCWRTQPF